jgi:PAS domain S-box-containing protein
MRLFQGKKKLAYRLITFITLFGLLVTLVSTAIQVKLEYDREILEIKKRFVQVQETYLQSIAENLWLLDTKRLQTILGGISRLPDFQFAEVVSDTGQIKVNIGSHMGPQGAIFSADIPYVHRGKSRIIGQFQLVANLDGALERVIRKAGFILSSIGIAIFFFAIIIYFAVHLTVTRHMSKMADFARNFSMENIDQILSLDRKNEDERKDELKDLVTAINEMRHSLKNSYDELQSLNAELETRVSDRTRDLTQEIAERKKALERLQDALTLNQTILEASPIGITIYDNMGQCVVANQAISDIFREEREDFLRQNFRRRVDWNNPLLSDLAVQASESGIPKFQEIKVETMGGREIDIENHMVPFLSGSTTHMMWLASDVTERKALQSQLIQTSKLATLGEMATGIAHELNQPLHIIRMAVSNIKRRIDKGKLDAEYIISKLGRIDTQTARASSIIDHMRVFGHKSSTVKEKIDLSRSVASVLDMIEEQLAEAKIKIETDLSGLPSSILGHEVQVEQVLINLIGNARDAILSNPNINDKIIKLVLGHSEDGSKIELSVSDSGGGISESLIDRIFEPFFTTKEVGEGTGLGLSIIYGIIQEMGGDISASNTGDGACFKITLARYV